MREPLREFYNKPFILMSKLSALENLSFNTTQIRTSRNGTPLYTGTGFYFNLPIEGYPMFPVLTTCKHVVEDSNQIHIRVSRADEQGNPLCQDQIEYEIDDTIGILWLAHPDPDVDLCLVPIIGLMNHMRAHKINIFLNACLNNIYPQAMN